jgi:pimeloyl-ACP methyl ester carboxylesterase
MTTNFTSETAAVAAPIAAMPAFSAVLRRREDMAMNATHASALVIALHCSGGTGRQWRKLAQRLPVGTALISPDLIGTNSRGHWSGDHAFSLADEAQPILALIDRHPGPVHVVGHSYGGGLALHVAAARPARIASLSLYEPSAFHILRHLGDAGRSALGEIRKVVDDIGRATSRGAYRAAAARFVDYWSDAGAFAAMKLEHQEELLRYLPKAALDFHALIHERTPLGRFRAFAFPVLVIRGEYAPRPTRTIADALLALVPDGIQIVVDGAGHMGPITHGDLVTELIARHLGENWIEEAAEAA